VREESCGKAASVDEVIFVRRGERSRHSSPPLTSQIATSMLHKWFMAKKRGLVLTKCVICSARNWSRWLATGVS